jgi:DNA-binding transcriptional MerR regulator
MDSALSIGALARRSGATPPTIRYYEQIGLLRRPDRRDGGHRVYGDADLKRLTFIRRCRDFGFPIEQVRDLVAVIEDADRSCTEVRDLARDQLLSVRSRLEELRELEASLSHLVADCEARCAGGPGPDCVILEDMAASAGGCCGA